MDYVSLEAACDLHHLDRSLNRKPLRVLVVEDDITLKKAVLRTLKMLDQSIEVEWATSADDFFLTERRGKQRGEKAFDLVLADINMPGVNSGLQIWNHFALLDRQIPVVMMSGLSERDFQKKIGQKPSVHYMQKPLNLKKCAAALHLCAPSHKKFDSTSRAA